MIRISSKREGFRRCGIAHSKEPTEYPDDRFTPAELKALKAEPMLVVEEVKPKGEKVKPKGEEDKLKGEEVKLQGEEVKPEK